MVTCYSWEDIRNHYEGAESALLVGNGASMAIWPRFGYLSLLDVARAAGRIDPVSGQLFGQEGSADFEAVLRRLRIAREVAGTFGLPTDQFQTMYTLVQGALRETVVQVHVPWLDAEEHLAKVRTAMLAHGEVFTSNYDLLLYWAVMHEGNQGDPLKDLFWGPGQTFDELDADVNNATPVYWLHGGVHLETLPSGVVRKRVGHGANLLGSFGDGIPLMITEGSGDEKRTAIGQSPYLNHAFLQLAQNRHSLTIVGHALNPASDSHIIDAVKTSAAPRIAVSIHEPEPGTVDELWGRVSGMFPPGGVDIHVFDATTHPLCAP